MGAAESDGGGGAARGARGAGGAGGARASRARPRRAAAQEGQARAQCQRLHASQTKATGEECVKVCVCLLRVMAGRFWMKLHSYTGRLLAGLKLKLLLLIKFQRR